MASAAALMVAVAVLALAGAGAAQLQYGFYKGKCNGSDVEAVVQSIVKARFLREAPIAAYLLRMEFHECVINVRVRRRPADRRAGTEKTAPPNLSVKGYDVIAAVKAELERRCPGVVSCSDIQILAARDAVALAGGPSYSVRTGRRDGRRSLASDAKLPGADYTAAQAVAYYGRVGLSTFDTVLLLGAHTLGATHCYAIKSRLYGYGGKPGATDPSMDAYTAFVYKNYVCPNTPSSDNRVVFLDDQWSALLVDNNYYKNIQRRRGVLAVDQNLYNDGSTRWIVDLLANNDGMFHSLFPYALVKLSEVNVLTGTKGKIRKVCNKFN
ncbi:hypothetical protein EJB05_23333, partial [Eragrostis curvula]